jgi:hypothetical protein
MGIAELTQAFVELRARHEALLDQHNARTRIENTMECTVSGLTHELVTMQEVCTVLVKRMGEIDAKQARLPAEINAVFASGGGGASQSAINSVNSQIMNLARRVDTLEATTIDLSNRPRGTGSQVPVNAPVFRPPTAGLAPVVANIPQRQLQTEFAPAVSSTSGFSARP